MNKLEHTAARQANSNRKTGSAIAIIGAGPAGCALACLLRLRGVQVILFDNGKRPELLVGESLIPAAINHLRTLGVEQAVAAISVLKPGAVLKHYEGTEVPFVFRDRGAKAPGYAYNVPRDKFDRILKDRALELGAQLIAHNASFVRCQDNPQQELELSPSSLAASGLSEHPQLLIDCTGRSRLFSRLLDIPAVRGERNDVAYFAHYENFNNNCAQPGQVIISVLSKGWSWSIPLPGRTSVGVVLNRHTARQLGSDSAQRLHAILENEPQLSARAQQARRLTSVMSYSNYQQMTTKGAGPGWALVGDAFGFVDPMLSPGVFMALEAAALFDRHTVVDKGTVISHDYRQYADELRQWHAAWWEVIEYFYDGRLVNLVKAGASITEQCSRISPSRLANWHVRRVIADLVSGVGTRSRYNRWVLQHSARYLVESNEELARLAVQ